LASVLQGHWLQTHSAHRLTHDALYLLLQWQPQLIAAVVEDKRGAAFLLQKSSPRNVRVHRSGFHIRRKQFKIMKRRKRYFFIYLAPDTHSDLI